MWQRMDDVACLADQRWGGCRTRSERQKEELNRFGSLGWCHRWCEAFGWSEICTSCRESEETPPKEIFHWPGSLVKLPCQTRVQGGKSIVAIEETCSVREWRWTSVRGCRSQDLFQTRDHLQPALRRSLWHVRNLSGSFHWFLDVLHTGSQCSWLADQSNSDRHTNRRDPEWKIGPSQVYAIEYQSCWVKENREKASEKRARSKPKWDSKTENIEAEELGSLT